MADGGCSAFGGYYDAFIRKVGSWGDVRSDLVLLDNNTAFACSHDDAMIAVVARQKRADYARVIPTPLIGLVGKAD